MDIIKLLSPCIRAAYTAGKAALEIYHQDFTVDRKEDDSPITLADRRSHAVISDALKIFGIPVLSEEGRAISYESRSNWECLWIVDPLDGTKEFIKKNGEFTVNIALVRKGEPILGVIYVPVLKRLYFAEKTIGSFRLDLAGDRHGNKGFLPIFNADFEQLVDASEKLPKKINADRPYTIVGSRSHVTPELEAFVQKIRKKHKESAFVSAGSSLKFCLVAEGSADIYPRLGPTMEWDTAAGDIIARASGAEVYVYESDFNEAKDMRQPLVYNKKDLTNPWFIVERK